MRVGYLGVGNIGELIAANTLAAGHDLMVFDVRPEPLERLRSRGARVACSPSELGGHAEILQVSIAGESHIFDALFGAGGTATHMNSGSVIALHSTMSPAAVRVVAEKAGALGVDTLEAQVSGGPSGAKARTLTFMTGGSEEVARRCEQVFAASGRRFFHMGPLGSGACAKLAQQMMTCINLVGVSEALRIARSGGLNIDAFLTMVESSFGQSDAASRWQREWAGLGQSSADGLYEGLRPALDLARSADVAVPMTALAQQLIRSAFGDN